MNMESPIRPTLLFATIATSICLFVSLAGPTLADDETWALADSPIVISSTMTIAAGDTVTIEPGVVVELQQAAKLFVEGSLVDVVGLVLRIDHGEFALS